MDYTHPLVVIATVWISIGVILGFVMRKRGHEFYGWFALGSVLGPLAIPVAFERVRAESQVDESLHGARRTPGDFDVLVALDGSEASEEALKRALPLLEASPTSYTFATVLPYEAHALPDGAEEKTRASEMLRNAAGLVDSKHTKVEVLYGEPSRVLLEYADRTGQDMVVIGARGRGASQRVFGSVATAVVNECEVPVLVGPRDVPVRLPYMRPD